MQSSRSHRRRAARASRRPRSQPGGIAQQTVVSRVARDVPFPLSGTFSNRVYEFVQSYEIPAAHVTSTTLATFSAYNFTISSLDQAASLSAVFDQYAIKHIQVTLIPRVGVADAVAQNYGLFTSVIDFDDANLLTTVGQALDYQNAVTTRGTDTHVRSWVPHAAFAAYSGAFSSYANVASPWVDWNSTTVQHYGLKAASTSTSSVITWDYVVRLHVACRNIR